MKPCWMKFDFWERDQRAPFVAILIVYALIFGSIAGAILWEVLK